MIAFLFGDLTSIVIATNLQLALSIDYKGNVSTESMKAFILSYQERISLKDLIGLLFYLTTNKAFKKKNI